MFKLTLSFTFAATLAAFLAACASKNYGAILADLSAFEQRRFALNCGTARYVLYVNSEPKFVLFDASLVVVASKILREDGFVNAKFLPPNSRFDNVFLGVIEMIKNAQNSSVLGACEVREI